MRQQLAVLLCPKALCIVLLALLLILPAAPITLAAPLGRQWSVLSGPRDFIAPPQTATLGTFVAPPRRVTPLEAGLHLPGSVLGIGPAYQWHTFYGSSGASGDFPSGFAVDLSGNIYVTGYSYASWNGPNGQLPLHSFTGYTDLFVLKLSSDGEYLWHTFYGGTSEDQGAGIALDASGNIYLTGFSNETWNGPNGQAPLAAHHGNQDILVMKLNSNGAYQWHAFYGAGGWNEGFDYGGSIAVGPDGYLYFLGASQMSWNGPAGQMPLSPHNSLATTDNYDFAVVKLSSSGEYQWHSFFGGVGRDIPGGIAMDDSSNIYFTGTSAFAWNGPNAQTPLHARSGSDDAVVLKLSSAGAFQWHTFYGSGSPDYGSGIDRDALGNLYIAGTSEGSWNGPNGESPVANFSGDSATFLMKLDRSGLYQWHTFHGYSWGSGIAIDSGGRIFVSGTSSGQMLVLEFSGNGVRQWSGLYGSGQAGNIVVNSNGVHVSGTSWTNWVGPNGQLPLHNHANSEATYNIAVIKFSNLLSDYFLPYINR